MHGHDFAERRYTVLVERLHGDVVVDTAKSHAVYKQWLEMTRPAPGPGGMRRPHWLLRPLRPSPEAYRMP